ncbi:MAG: hypothetical protein H0V09_00870 [Gemmatimonadetes bacterium]|nr:hypothetical protein [Gemmatimonadota bacterium]
MNSEKIESVLRTLPEVRAAKVALDVDGSIAEIHLVAPDTVSAKATVRNVESLLKAALGLDVDHRVISVAQVRLDADVGGSGGKARAGGTLADLPNLRRGPARVRFLEVNFTSEAPFKVKCEVTLDWGGESFSGAATDTSTARSRPRLAARAACDALESFLERNVALSLEHFQILDTPVGSIALACLRNLGREDRQRTLVGSALIEEDPNQAAVLAVLDALNRMVLRAGGPSA